MMTNREAIKEIIRRICCEKPVQHFCDDSCMYGKNECSICMARIALEKQIPEKPILELFYAHPKVYKCPNCKSQIYAKENGKIIYGIASKYCPNCGQALKWYDDIDKK